MKLSELMSALTAPNASFKGEVMADDMILAVDCSEDGTASEQDYAVVLEHITGATTSLNASSKDDTYLRVGTSSSKTGNQRTFTVGGHRYVGDEFQDFALSHKIMYGTGQTVVRPYVYFNVLTGKGEKGTVAIIVNSENGAEADNKASIDIELKKSGATAVEYTYSAA